MAKLKQRTRKAAAKRFKITANSKVLHRSQKIRHLKAHKSKRRQRRMNQLKAIQGVMAKKIKKMLGLA